MQKRIPCLILILILIPLFSAGALTVLVNSVQEKEFKDLTPDEKKMITVVENGVMDILFEKGFIFFSHYLKIDSGKAFETAKVADADFLLVIHPDCESGNINWQVYKISGKEKVGSGTIIRKNIPDVEEMSDSEFYYHTGTLIGLELVNCALGK